MAATGDALRIAAAQIAPVWGDRERTLAKVVDRVREAGEKGCHLVCFGEALVPGYPFWVEETHATKWNSDVQKEIHAHYMDQSVQIEAGHLAGVSAAAKAAGVNVYLGVIERPQGRGGHSLYCSYVFIDANGAIRSVHRKLMPTYGERLVWSVGDGAGLRVHSIAGTRFTAGGLNCWENWMPLTRAALYAQGEDLHVAGWPGGEHNTKDITPFLAKEGRSYSVAVSCLMRPQDMPQATPHRELILKNYSGAGARRYLADGGSCIAGPDGQWVVPPAVGEEVLLVADLDHRRVREERQNFDPSGHYSRPDVLQLSLNRTRQGVLSMRGPKL